MAKTLHRNDTYGDLDDAELAELREHAIPCLRCGMLATVDPVFHEGRYGHAPAVLRDGRERVWSTRRLGWEAS